MTYLKSVWRVSMIRLVATPRLAPNLRIQRGRQIRPIWMHALASRRKRAHGLLRHLLRTPTCWRCRWTRCCAASKLLRGRDSEAGTMTGMKKCRVLFWAGNAALERLKPVRAPRNLSSPSRPARNPAVHCEHQSTRCALIGAHEREFACPFGNAKITSHRTAFYTVMYAV